jgi:hypothetical protein
MIKLPPGQIKISPKYPKMKPLQLFTILITINNQEPVGNSDVDGV